MCRSGSGGQIQLRLLFKHTGRRHGGAGSLQGVCRILQDPAGSLHGLFSTHDKMQRRRRVSEPYRPPHRRDSAVDSLSRSLHDLQLGILVRR